jgi:anaerobic selenocysteine-containing dehydrogenase
MKQTPRKRQATRRPFDKVRRSTCANCPVGCGVKAFMNGNQLVDLFGDEDHPANKGSLCPKGLLSWIHLSHPDRIIRPRIRQTNNRSFRDVGWEEALAFIGVRVAALKEQFDPNRFVIHADDGSPFNYSYGAGRFAACLGTENGPDRFYCAALGNKGRIAGMFGVNAGRLLMNSQHDWAYSRCILIIGSDPAATDPVTLGPLVDVRDRGGSVVVVDSKTTMSAIKASYFVRVRPGTETILLAAIANLLIAEKHVDNGFINDATTGFDDFEKVVAAFTPRSTAAACDISEEDIYTLAKVVGGAHPVQVMCGDWLTRSRLSDELLGLCAAIVCLRGSVGIPGGGLNILDVSPFASSHAKPTNLEKLLVRNNGPAAVFCYGNPVARLCGGMDVRRRLANVPLVVQIGGCSDETSKYATVQLPPATWLEEDSLSASSNGRVVQWRNAIVQPKGETRPILDIWADLAKACGLIDAFPDQTSRGNSLARAVADSMLKANVLTSGISVADLDPEVKPPGGVLWPCVSQADLKFEEDRFNRGDVRGPNILFRRHRKFANSDQRFPTADGKVSLAMAAPSPVSTEPSLKGRGDGLVNVSMVASVGVDYVDGWSGCCPTPSRAPVGIIVRIHPSTADQIGVRSGGTVIVKNKAGEFRGIAELSLAVASYLIWCIETPGSSGQEIGPFGLFEIPAEGEPQAAYVAVSVKAFKPLMSNHAPE